MAAPPPITIDPPTRTGAMGTRGTPEAALRREVGAGATPGAAPSRVEGAGATGTRGVSGPTRARR
jgi:hypothetical protein